MTTAEQPYRITNPNLDRIAPDRISPDGPGEPDLDPGLVAVPEPELVEPELVEDDLAPGTEPDLIPPGTIAVPRTDVGRPSSPQRH